MKHTLTFLAILLLAPLAALHAANFHVAPDGNDRDAGTSSQTAWKSLERVNSQLLHPGDAVLFRSGGVWLGQLRPQGSGAEGKPIRIDRYGDGPLPVIDAGTNVGAVVSLVDQDWWEIRHLELRGSGANAPPGDRQGIHVQGLKAARVLRHIHITGCRIADIHGTLGYNSCGILVTTPSWENSKRADPKLSVADVLIAGNDVRRVSRVGIFVLAGGAWPRQISTDGNGTPVFAWASRPPGRDIVVSGNTVEDLGGDAIMVIGADKPLVEHNTVRRSCQRTGASDIKKESGYNPHSAAIWMQHGLNGVMQFNDVSHTRRQPGNADATAFDFDINCFQCVVQYNVSRENDGGLLLIMNTARHNVVRYNLCQNDGRLFYVQGEKESENVIHNNVFYNDRGQADIVLKVGDQTRKGHLGVRLRNNIFLARKAGRFGVLFTTGLETGRFVGTREPAPLGMFERNCFYGTWEGGIPADPQMIEADPQLLAPGTGGDGLNSWRGYQLQSSSPCLRAGLVIPSCGERDFWGNPLRNGKPDIGANESQFTTKATP